MKTALTLAASLIVTLAYTQDNNPVIQQQIVDQVGRENYMGVVQTYDTRYQGVKGSPFVEDDWCKGSVTYLDGTTFSEIPVRFNAYENELWVKNRAGQEVVTYKSKLREFTVDNKEENQPLYFIKSRYVPGLAQLINPEQIVQVLYDKDVVVVSTRTIILKKADYKDPYSVNRRYDEFIETDPVYYVVREDQRVDKLKPKRKSFMKAFAGKSDAIQEYIERYDLDLNDPQAVSAMLSAINP